MHWDTFTLSRIQFAFTIMFHYIFPPLSIGLGVLLVMMEGLSLRTGNLQYRAMTRFWVRIFAVNFAVAVATGITMEFQFGTNWSRYSRYVGDVFGAALAAEGIFAFFLESGFLAVLVFGWDRVSPRMHFFSTCMVSLGSMFSAVWIVVANSFMHTPAGYKIVQTATGPRAMMTDFWAVVFNPSSMQRLVHVILAAWILGSFFVMSITAWYLLKKRHEEFARKSFTLALMFGTASIVGIWISGDGQARAVASSKPAALAAYEGNLHSSTGGTPMTLFGWPNQKENRIEYHVAIPKLLSFLVSGDPNKPVTAMDQIPVQDRPPLAIPFQAYHLMVMVGGLLLTMVGYAQIQWWRGKLFQQRWLLWCFVFAVIFPYLANQAGWVCAEVGRQPWVVYGLLRTSEAFSPRVPASHVLASLIMFSVIYAMLFLVWFYALTSTIRKGPEPVQEMPPATIADGVLQSAAIRGASSPFEPPKAEY